MVLLNSFAFEFWKKIGLQWKSVNFCGAVKYDPNKVWSFQKVSQERASLLQGKREINYFQRPALS